MQKKLQIEPLKENLIYFIRWSLISFVMGTVCGLVGAAFGKSVLWAQGLFRANPILLYLLPVSGILIVALHHLLCQIGNRGTNLVLDSVSSTEKLHFALFPCIYISTILSQLAGASAGKEGAALQIGGCIGNYLGDVLKLDERDKKVAIMSGMSGCFAAIFGTPLAASMFGMEVISVGVAYYAALVPCVFAAFIGVHISGSLGLSPEAFTILHIPEFDWGPLALLSLLGLVGAAVSVCFCILLHETHRLYVRVAPNPYKKILLASVLFLMLVLLFGRDYCSAGFNLVETAMEGEGRYEAFLLKMLFTAVALGGGFKGGEIVPTLAVGATLGCAFGRLTGFEPSLCAACGLLSLFVGVTNCPIATMFLGFELFGFEAMPFFAIVVAISFTLSGYYGLYSSQKFVYSKTKTEFINRKAN